LARRCSCRARRRQGGATSRGRRRYVDPPEATWFGVNAAAERTSFFGAPVRRSGSERLQLWQSDGPGRDPKLRVVVRSTFSQVPEKPLGLYDPSYDRDSCGVGFVAELSGESSRKTVRIELNLIEFLGICEFYSVFGKNM